MKIGVFDSGIGGKSVANALKKAYKNSDIIFVSDPGNLPYGTKTPNQLKLLITPKLDELLKNKVETVVIACNTVSTTILDYVKDYVSIPVLGVVPMIKEASLLTKKNTIAVCATPTTLGSAVYADLKNKFAKNLKVIEPDCSRWTRMIEDNKVDREEISQIVNNACESGADVIVLGCTHYHWIEDLIKQIAGSRAVIIQPESKLVKEVGELFKIKEH